MTRWSWIRPSARIPAEPGLYRVLVELDDGTLEEQVAGWSEREGFRGAGGQPSAVIAWGEGRAEVADVEAGRVRQRVARALAVIADCDDRTAIRYLAGHRVRPDIRARLDDAAGFVRRAVEAEPGTAPEEVRR